MFLSFLNHIKSLTVRDIYLKCALPALLMVSLCFHKFAAVYIIFATLGFYLLKQGTIRKNIVTILKSTPFQLLLTIWLWASLTLLWSINFENGLSTSLKLVGMLSLSVLIFSTTSKIQNKVIESILSFLTFCILCVIFSYLLMPLFEHKYEKPLAYFLALFFFPTALYLREFLPRHLKFLVLILFGLTLLTMIQSGAQSGLIGFIIGFIIFLLTIFRPHHTTLFLKTFTFLWTLFTPVLMLVFTNTHHLVKYINFTGSSLYHRFCIWTFVTSKVFENPLLGWGLGSSKKFPDSHKKYFQYLTSEQLSLFDVLNQKSYILNFINMPLHPHNNALQVYLELGLVGGILYSLFLASVFQLFLKVFKDKVVLATANAMAVLTLVIFNMSHSIWHMWLLSWIILSFAMLYAISIYRSRKIEGENYES